MLQARFFGSTLLLLLFWIGAPSLSAQEKTDSMPVVSIKAGGAVLQAEVARTPEEKARGLMHRTRLADNAGMIFIFDGKTRASFWMKNTAVPLSIAFIDSKGIVLEIADMKPFDETTINSASDHVAFALEVNQNWFALNRIKAGTTLTIAGTTWADFLKPR